MSFLDKLENEILVFDGGMGTLIQNKGVKFDCPDELVLTKPDMMKSLHKEYSNVGVDVIQSFTFGANRIKLEDYNLGHKAKEINSNAIKLVKKVSDKCYAALSAGPTGKYLKPIGNLNFDEAYNIFSEQVKAGADGGADLIAFETFSDIMELKAAVLAAKENTDLPVVAQMSFENDRTATGTDPETFVSVIKAMGVDVLGVNCSLGPKEIYSIVEILCKKSKIPIIVQPNAGLPQIVDKKTIFKASPEYVAEYAARFVDLGVNIVGGCCGTTPLHLKEIVKKIKQKKPVKRNIPNFTTLSSRTNTLEISDYPVIIGERINPTARSALITEIKQGKTHLIRKEAAEQAKEGASLIDINVGVPGNNEEKAIQKAVLAVQNTTNIPIVIDTTNPMALEAALKVCNGKPLINSVTGEEKSLSTVLPLAKKYGAAVIGICLDEQGVPKTTEQRVAIAQRIVKRAQKYISKNDIFIDCVTTTISSDPDSVKEIMKSIRKIKKMGVRTTLGISNISHGLPNRSLINSSFLTIALSNELDAPIINPLDKRMMEAFKVGALLGNKDIHAQKYIDSQAGFREEAPNGSIMTIRDKLYYSIINGEEDTIIDLVEEALGEYKPFEINEILLSGLNKVGIKFKNEEFFLPQVIMSAAAMKKGFERIKKEFKKIDAKPNATILFATVEDDVHDIGKNIVIALLESRNYKVIDLGKNVKKQNIISMAKKHKPDLICLSALMTTTVINIPKVIKTLKKEKINVPVMAGGAVVTKDYAKSIGVDYAKDAIETITKLKKIFGGKNE